jgi:hypothetical protein
LSNKEIIYKSPIYFTPMTSPVEIDADADNKIVELEYAAAGMKPGEDPQREQSSSRVRRPASRMPTWSSLP